MNDMADVCAAYEKAYDMGRDVLISAYADLLRSHVQIFKVSSGMGTIAVFGGRPMSLISDDSAFGTKKQRDAIKALELGLVRQFNDIFNAPPDFVLEKKNNRLTLDGAPL